MDGVDFVTLASVSQNGTFFVYAINVSKRSLFSEIMSIIIEYFLCFFCLTAAKE